MMKPFNKKEVEMDKTLLVTILKHNLVCKIRTMSYLEETGDMLGINLEIVSEDCSKVKKEDR